jgi:uncharacterized membrane protein YbhN (UPF0104 family)
MSVLTFLESPAGRFARATVSAAALAALIALTDWRSLRVLPGNVSWTYVAVGMGLTIASYPLCAWRWRLLLRAQGVGLTFRRVHAVTWIGQFYNAFLPGGIGGDVTRLVYALTEAPGQKSRVAVAIGADRLIGFGVLLLLAAIALLFHAAGNRVNVAGVPFGVVVAAAAATGGLGVFIAVRWFVPKLPGSLQASIELLFRSSRTNLIAAGASVLIWGLDFAGGWFLARSLGLSISFIDISLGLTIAYLSTALPISIGGHGVREGALVLTLTALGTAADLLPSLALLFWIVSLACSLIGGATLIISRRSRAVERPS